MSGCPRRVTELNVTRLEKKKMSFWLNRAQTRLADLAVVSSGIQADLLPNCRFSFYPLYDNSFPIPLRRPVYCQQLEF